MSRFTWDVEVVTWTKDEFASRMSSTTPWTIDMSGIGLVRTVEADSALHAIEQAVACEPAGLVVVGVSAVWCKGLGADVNAGRTSVSDDQTADRRS